jgi:hypothetical protein
MERINNNKAKVTVELVMEIEFKKLMYGYYALSAHDQKIFDKWEHCEKDDGTMGLQTRIKLEAMSKKENEERQKMGLSPRVLRPNARCP